MSYHLFHCLDLFGTGAPLQTLKVLPSNGTLSLFEGGRSDVYSDMSEKQSDMKWAWVTITHKIPPHK